MDLLSYIPLIIVIIILAAIVVIAAIVAAIVDSYEERALFPSTWSQERLSMSETPLSISWLAIAMGLLPFTAMLGFVVWLLTSPPINALRLGQPIPAQTDWSVIVLGDSICFAAFAAIWRSIYCAWKTVFTDEYVRQPRFLGGMKQIRWSEITSVQKVKQYTRYGTAYGIRLNGVNGDIVIHPAVYKNPGQMEAEISRHLLEHRAEARVEF